MANIMFEIVKKDEDERKGIFEIRVERIFFINFFTYDFTHPLV